jgi:hypothetical protein
MRLCPFLELQRGFQADHVGDAEAEKLAASAKTLICPAA